jgi:hypothetical protein
MAGAPTLTERYARALANLHSSQAHEARAHVGNLTLQIGLLAEILRRPDSATPEARAKVERCLERAGAAVREVHGALERLLTQTDLGAERGPVDLGQLAQRVGALIAPLLDGRRLGWRLAVPEDPLVLDIDRALLWQALVVAVVEGTETMAPGETFEIVLERPGRWAMSGPRDGEWAGPLRQVFETHGGEIIADTARLEIRLPSGARR